MQLYTTLQARAQKRALSNLVMSEASPILSEKKFDLIPLPGQDRNHDQVCVFFAQPIHAHGWKMAYHTLNILQWSHCKVLAHSSRRPLWCRNHLSIDLQSKLFHYWPMFPIYTLWKHQKTRILNGDNDQKSVDLNSQ